VIEPEHLLARVAWVQDLDRSSSTDRPDVVATVEYVVRMWPNERVSEITSKQGHRSSSVWTRSVIAGVLGIATVGAASVQVAQADVFPDQLGFDLDGESPGDSAGAVALSADGSRVALGSPGHDGNGRDSGHVRIFDFESGRWVQVGDAIGGRAPLDSAGRSVALSADGNRVAVGGPRSDGGSVRVFDWDGAAWSQAGADLIGSVAERYFGAELALSDDGTRIVIGTAGDDSGYVRVLDWDGSTWSQAGSDLDVVAGGLLYAVALSDDGNRLAVGASDSADGVRVFDWDGVDWSQVGGAISVESEPDGFGIGVALSGSGDRVAVAARGNADEGPPGGAWVFELVSGTWEVMDSLESDQVRTVALSADGNRLVRSGPFPWDGTGETVIRDFDGSEWADVASIGADDFGDEVSEVALSADGGRVAIGSPSNFLIGASGTLKAGQVRVFDLSESPPPPPASLIPVVPARLLETRVGGDTVDGVSAGVGRRVAGSVAELQVAGRGGIGPDSVAALLNVAVVGPADQGYVTVYPCDSEPPLASSLNYAAGRTVSNAVFTELSSDGTVCVFTSAATDLVVDVTGQAPIRSGLRPVGPTRVIDSRTGIVQTDYEDWLEIERLAAGSVYQVRVTGRGGVPFAVDSVMMNVAVVKPNTSGFLTVYPCESEPPLASSVNYAPGQTVSNSVFSRTMFGSKVCIYTSAETAIVIDATGYTPAPGGLLAVEPTRLLETRAGQETADGMSEAIGRRSAGSTTEFQVHGRGGIPGDSSAVLLNVAAVRPDASGYLTVYPCDVERPLAASLNYSGGEVVSNSVFSQVSDDGRVCVYNSGATDLVVDVTARS
jgi:hypothetical protein